MTELQSEAEERPICGLQMTQHCCVQVRIEDLLAFLKWAKQTSKSTDIIGDECLYIENMEKDPPWAMMFADDLVLCATTREEYMETWRVVFERHGLKISRTKTAYLPSPTNDTETTLKSGDVELPTVTYFKYLGSLFTSEKGSQANVNNRIRIR